MFRSSAGLTVTAVTIVLGLIPASSWAETPDPGAAPAIAAAVEDAGQSEAVASNPDVTVPQTAGAGIEVNTQHGSQVSLSIPAAGAADVQGETAVFDGDGRSNSVAVESTADGVRALVDIVGPEAPERYAFIVGGDAARLSLEVDGSVTVLNAGGDAVGHVATPWARDATGAEIATHFEVAGTTITQVVSHRSGLYAYPIVADPFWSTAWKVTKCVAAVGALFFVGSRAYRAVKELGGVWNAAKLLVRAGGIHDFASLAGHAAAAVLGADMRS